MKQGQFPAILPLTSLDGQIGFKIDGENNGDHSGYSVSALGDINSDGHTDLIIGAPSYPDGGNKGRSYVVFGGPPVVHVPTTTPKPTPKKTPTPTKKKTITTTKKHTSTTTPTPTTTHIPTPTASQKKGTFPAVVQLSALNGQNGFKLQSEDIDGRAGYSVSGAGDINGDGYADLIIGEPGTLLVGSYVVFGGPGVGGNGTIALSSLDGATGFKFDDESGGGGTGFSVSGAEDINGDGYADLIIGDAGYQTDTGRSYVVFGGLGVGSSGVFSLSSLTGANGFKLDGENIDDVSGYSVSGAGDVNGDEYADLIIGAIGYPGSNDTGRSYVVFGGPDVGSGGDIALSSLSGANGFKLDGENFNDRSGYSVSGAGDINGDGYADLIIGDQGVSSYVIFGGPDVGSSGIIALSSLDGATGFKLDSKPALPSVEPEISMAMGMLI